MKNFTRKEFERLAAFKDEICVSIYMPTDPSANIDKQRIRFKNLLRRAEKAVEELAPGHKTLFPMIDTGWRLMENADFWRYRSDGLAFFIAPATVLYYRLPVRFEEDVSVLDHFTLKPLIPLFMADRRFYILALSPGQIRLFACTRHSVMEIEMAEAPQGIDAFLQYDNKQYQIQFHTKTAAGAGDRPAMFHGQGVGIDDRKDEITRYFREVDKVLGASLQGEAAPLVLAGVDYLIPLFREVSAYPWVMGQSIGGNPEALHPEALHRKALGIVEPVLNRKLRDEEARYRELAGKGYTAAGIRTVVPAAAFGRVETLFVAVDQRRPGRFDPTGQGVIVSEEDRVDSDDLLDTAAVETLRHGGNVFAVDSAAMPEDHAAAAAILRY